MSEERRRQIGESEAPVEDELQESFDNTITEGAERLHRTFRTILITGVFGGLEVGLGVMAYLAVMHETGDHKQLGKLWGGTLLANLAGGWVFMWLVMQAFPQWPTVAESAKHFTEAPFSLQTVALAVLGGSTITLMSRMQQGTSSDPAKIVATVIGGFLLAGLQLFHSILDSLLIFGAIQSGAGITYLEWFVWFSYTLLFNMVGGLVLVTALRLVRTKELLMQRRREAPDDPDASRRTG